MTHHTIIAVYVMVYTVGMAAGNISAFLVTEVVIDCINLNANVVTCYGTHQKNSPKKLTPDTKNCIHITNEHKK